MEKRKGRGKGREGKRRRGRKKEREREIERERHQPAASHMCPDWELNLQPFHVQEDTPTN